MKKPIVRGLQGNLTLSYTYITAIALLITELIGLLFFQSQAPTRVFQGEPDVDSLQPFADEAAVYLAEEPADLDELQAWLDSLSTPVLNVYNAEDWFQVSLGRFPNRERQMLLIAKAEDGVLAATPSDSPYANVKDLAELPGRLDQAMFSTMPVTPGRNAVAFRHENSSVVVLPITTDDKQLLGLFIVITELSTDPPSTLSVLLVLGGSLLIFTVLAASVGTLFGFYTSKRLTQRLYHLVDATSAWGQGDFSPRIDEKSGDEIGQLATHLTQLAQQLQELLAAREQWVATETRHHLARELHDSVKQQIFAVRMHLASAQAMAATAPDKVKPHIDLAEGLAQQSQQELRNIIDVLRAEQSSSDTMVSLRDMAKSWATQSNIDLTTQLPSTLRLKHSVEHELLRILQEALANVWKHSQATKASLTVTAFSSGRCRIVVADNGTGFDPRQAHTGFGIQSMQDRVERLGGSFSITSGADGTRIVLEIPLESGEEKQHV